MQNIFKFCPRCKNKLDHKSNRLIDCPFCHFHFYINPALANAIIFENKKNEILLVKRKTDPFVNSWDLPGGFVEYDESGEESVIREVKEELKIKITTFKYLCSYPDLYPYKGFDYHTLCLFYISQISPKQEKNLKASDDISGFKFFKKNNVPYNKLAFKGLKYAIRFYLNSSFFG